MKKTIWINIAGDAFPVVFDGETVSTPEFPNIPMSYTAKCGVKITQAMLVLICAKKLDALEAYCV
jgi:hypothetical protein